MHYVYLLKSESSAGRRYVGMTANLKQGFTDRISGKSPHTAKYIPSQLVTYVALSEKRNADKVER